MTVSSCVIKSEIFPLKILIFLSSVNGYHFVQNLLSSILPSSNVSIKIYRAAILSCSFVLVVKVGLSHWKRNVGWRCSRIVSWEIYFGLRVTRQERSDEDGITRISTVYINHRNYSGDQIKNDTGGTFGRYGGQKRYTQDFGREIWWIFKNWW